MNQTEARTLREAHNAYVRRLNGKTRAALAVEYRADLADRGMTTLFGGPVSRDELIRALCELHYPMTKLNEAICVMAHDTAWPDCPYCQADQPCRQTDACLCAECQTRKFGTCPICHTTDVVAGDYFTTHARPGSPALCPSSGQSTSDGAR